MKKIRTTKEKKNKDLVVFENGAFYSFNSNIVEKKVNVIKDKVNKNIFSSYLKIGEAYLFVENSETFSSYSENEYMINNFFKTRIEEKVLEDLADNEDEKIDIVFNVCRSENLRFFYGFGNKKEIFEEKFQNFNSVDFIAYEPLLLRQIYKNNFLSYNIEDIFIKITLDKIFFIVYREGELSENIITVNVGDDLFEATHFKTKEEFKKTIVQMSKNEDGLISLIKNDSDFLNIISHYLNSIEIKVREISTTSQKRVFVYSDIFSGTFFNIFFEYYLYSEDNILIFFDEIRKNVKFDIFNEGIFFSYLSYLCAIENHEKRNYLQEFLDEDDDKKHKICCIRNFKRKSSFFETPVGFVFLFVFFGMFFVFVISKAYLFYGERHKKNIEILKNKYEKLIRDEKFIKQFKKDIKIKEDVLNKKIDFLKNKIDQYKDISMELEKKKNQKYLRSYNIYKISFFAKKYNVHIFDLKHKKDYIDLKFVSNDLNNISSFIKDLNINGGMKVEIVSIVKRDMQKENVQPKRKDAFKIFVDNFIKTLKEEDKKKKKKAIDENKYEQIREIFNKYPYIAVVKIKP